MKDVIVSVHLTPAQLAEQFWHMGSDEQADFFAALREVAGGKLCLQTAYMVDEIASRQAKGDSSAADGFLTLFSHAEAYIEVLVDRVARLPMTGRIAP